MCRAIISLSTKPDQRTPFYSALSTAKFAGYALMPSVAAVITTNAALGALHINSFTLPVIILLIFNILLIPAVLWGLTDPRSEYRYGTRILLLNC